MDKIRLQAVRKTGARICSVAGCSEPLTPNGVYRWCEKHEFDEYNKLVASNTKVPSALPTRSAPDKRRLPNLEAKCLDAIRHGLATTAAIVDETHGSHDCVATALRWLESDGLIERTAPGVYRVAKAK